jgi:hypothetical protein
MIGPSMGILAHNTHVTFTGIATALASGGVGGLLTNIFCGVFHNLVNNYQDLLLIVAFFLRAIRTIKQTFVSCPITRIFISL